MVNKGLSIALLSGLVSVALGASPVAGKRPHSHDPPRMPAVFQAAAADTFAYVDRVTDGNLLGLNVTNYGFFGNDFVTRDPSMEYPLGSEVDHLIRAGLWFGAINVEGDTLVTTGTVDGYWRTGGSSTSEFTPRARFIRERSLLIFRSTYHPDAVSEQDFYAVYDDLGLKPRPGIQQHRPLGIQVVQNSYLWSYEFANSFVIMSFDITNVSDQVLTNLYLGLYAEMASGWKGGYERWPPSGWFHNKVLHYEEESHFVAEHRTNFGNGSAPQWGAVKFLGTVPPPDERADGGSSIAFNWWDWNPGSTERDEDSERYELMINGEVDDVSTIGQAGADDPVEMISVGPFNIFSPGDTIRAVFAFMGGKDLDHLRSSAVVAQDAYESGYVIPGPPPSPRLLVSPGDNMLEICWEDSVESVPDPADSTLFDFEGYRIYVTRQEAADSEDFVLIREMDVAGNGIGYETGLDEYRMAEAVIVDGVEYNYRYVLDNLKDGFRYWVSVTSFDTGNEKIGSLESGIKQNLTMAVPGTRAAANPRRVTVFPNPYHGDAVWDGARERERYLWFANLPERALIRIYSLSGDLVEEIDFDGNTYAAGNISGIRSTSGEGLSFSGGMCAWDLISRSDQPVASGLYMFTVSDRSSGEVSVGKFMVIR